MAQGAEHRQNDHSHDFAAIVASRFHRPLLHMMADAGSSRGEISGSFPATLFARLCILAAQRIRAGGSNAKSGVLCKIGGVKTLSSGCFGARAPTLSIWYRA